MKKHITTVGILNIGLGIVGILAAIIVLTTIVGIGLLVFLVEGETEPLPFMIPVGCGTAFFLIVGSVPDIISGIGVLKLKPWARYMAMVLGVVKLFNIPIGTAVGVYTLWAMMQDEAEELFAPEPSE